MPLCIVSIIIIIGGAICNCMGGIETITLEDTNLHEFYVSACWTSMCTYLILSLYDYGYRRLLKNYHQ